VILKTARRWKRIRENPLDDVDPPKLTPREMVILTEDEVARLLAAFNELATRNPDEAAWWTMTRRMVLVVLGTAIRRGELLGLRWDAIDLLGRRLEVRQAWVRNAMVSPKSSASRRSIHFGLKTAAALEEQFQATSYEGDDALVFGHSELGTPLDPSELTRSYLKPALKAGRDRQAVPAVARPQTHRVDVLRDHGRGDAADGAGPRRPFAVRDHGALRPRSPTGRYRCGPGGGASFRGLDLARPRRWHSSTCPSP
jgi:integrase